MKKILIINQKHHSEIGGIETYTSKLINLFLLKNFYVYEMNRMNSKKKIDSYIYKNKKYFCLRNKHCINSKNKLNKIQIISFIREIIRKIKENIFINSIVKKHKIDVVILNMYHSLKIRPLKNTRYIWVQHVDSTQYIEKNKIFKLIKKFLHLKDSFHYDKIVTYTKNNIDFCTTNKLIKNKFNIVSITPGIRSFQHTNNLINIEIQNKNKITFIGRLESIDKNVLFLNEITKQAKMNKQEIKIHVYGEGSERQFLEQNKNLVVHNSFSNKNIKEILNDTKVLILVSKSEGFGLVIAEALSHGVPCIIANTFLNASFLIDDSRGKLMNDFDPQAWVDAINEIMNLNDDEYQKLSNNCLQFAKENLSLEQFNKKWLELIES